MLPKTFIFFAVSCLTAASASNLDAILHSKSGNGNYIIQLNQTTCIKDFVPKFIDGAFEIFSQNFGGHHNFEKRNNRIVRRDTQDDQVHVFDAYDIGHAFKAISVKFEELAIVKNLLSTFDDEILKIIPDEDIQFDLPTNKKKALKKRYYIRSAQPHPTTQSSRSGNFNYDNYKHDENCPHKNDEVDSKKALPYEENLAKRGVTTKKSTTKKTTSKRRTTKKTTTKKKTTTTKTTTKKTTTKKTTTKKTTTKKTTAKKTTTKKTTAKRATTTKSVISSAGYSKQTNPEWNLARVSQRKRDYTKPYIYDTKAGSDAYVYVVDDGMNIGHVDFEGRAKWGWSAYTGISKVGGGHGTHVGGIIGSKTYGVAKKTNLIAVQVLNEQGSGAISAFLAGLQWVTDNAKAHKGKSVINMSLGMRTEGNTSPALKAFDDAINAVIQSGIPIVAAAGNWDSDTCNVSPAGNKNVYAVGASDKNDAMTSFSGFGKCVQINAPGNNIKSLYIDSTTSTTTMSGTSMASPHVAGVAALVIGQLNNPTPADLYKELTNLATKGAVTKIKGATPNLLLFNGQQLTTD